MIRMMKDTGVNVYNKVARQDLFCRTISFFVFSMYGTSASKIWENKM